MDATIFAWTLLATLFAGFHVFASKVTASKGLDSALNGVFGYGLASAISFGVCMYQGVWPAAWVMIALWALADGLVHSIGSITRIDALRYIDSTIYFPINKILGPLLVVFCGVLILGEHITPLQWLGIIGALFIPLLLIDRAEHRRQKDLKRGLVLCVVSTFFTGITIIVIKAGLAYADSFWLFMALANLFGALTSAFLYAKKHKFSRTALNIPRHDIEVGLGVGLLGFLSCFALFTALQYGYASLVYTIHAHYILIPIFLSVWWYGEHINLRKFAAVVLSCVTLMLLY